ncbi:hypothetical protein LZ318_30830 [Saccharopolyspora indica]|uniref:hypothetical protein n=1 Tax=Saccharopolyspora indica TaxID=1229659 RepID=UPI0022EA6509|nr:hypothetical protein [Saccharopolyspora indica]MDA3644372.1 hypothetical protein [Saccharopolyspora indica]
MSTTDLPSHYDPAAVFAHVFDNGLVADYLAQAMCCTEVNALVAVLEASGHLDGARYWLETHRADCDRTHLH